MNVLENVAIYLNCLKTGQSFKLTYIGSCLCNYNSKLVIVVLMLYSFNSCYNAHIYGLLMLRY